MLNLLGSADTILVSSALAIAVAASVLIAAACGVFVPSKGYGPSRLDENESPSDIAIVAFVGVVTWLGALSIYAYFRQMWLRRIEHIESPSTLLTQPENVVVNLVGYLIAFLTFMAVSAFWRTNGLERLGATRSRILSGVWLGVVGIIIMLPLVLVTSIATDAVWTHYHLWHEQQHELLKVLKETPKRWVKVADFLLAAVAAPLAEETFFRGHIQTILRTFGGSIASFLADKSSRPARVIAWIVGTPWLSIVIASLLFAWVHAWWMAPPIFVLALGLGYLYERTGNLWACIVMHSLFNIASMTLFYFQEMKV